MSYTHKLFTAAKTPFIAPGKAMEGGGIYLPRQSSIKASEASQFFLYAEKLVDTPSDLDSPPLVELRNLEDTIMPLIHHARKSPVKALQKMWILDGTLMCTDLQTVKTAEFFLPIKGSHIFDAYQLDACLRTLVEDSVTFSVRKDFLFVYGQVLKKQKPCWLYAIPLRQEQHYATKLRETYLNTTKG